MSDAFKAMSANKNAIQFAHLNWLGREISLEYTWVGAVKSAYPTVVFLHEGLGSISMWKDFPQKFCEAHNFRGLVLSRYGYGNSTPRPHGERWGVDFMHRQAHEVLPLFFKTVGIDRPWLFGHSDGGTIALLYAARYPDRVSGIAVVAPHIFVEDVTIDNIHTARALYLQQDLRARIGRHHADVDSAFWGWNDVWLDPAFRAFNIEAEIATIACPVIAVQGDADEYGTLEQIYGIQRKIAATRIVVLPQCGHSPHRDQPQALTQAVAQFMRDQHINRSA